MKMLQLLREIVQEVSSLTVLDEVLGVIVKRIRSSMNTDVCSVYLYNPDDKQYILMANEGLNPDAVGRVALSSSQGLVALVGAREEPVNINNASQHPSFYPVPDIDEQDFDAFVGVPIIHHKRLLGVMVVQQSDSRQFDDGEESFLVTLSAQLASVIAHAEATGNIVHETTKTLLTSGQRRTRFQGVAGASGVGLGYGVVVSPVADITAVIDKCIDNPSAEQARFEQAIKRTRDDFVHMHEGIKGLNVTEVALFDVYLNMLDDRTLHAAVNDKIAAGQWAPGALRDVIQQYVGQFEVMEDDYLRERAADIRDLGTRILAHLEGSCQRISDTQFAANSVVVAHELTAPMLAELPLDRISGLVSVCGSSNSHAAILARALGIPSVVGINDLPFAKLNDRPLIVDGYRGLLFANPSAEEQSRYQAIVDEEQQQQKALASLRDEPATTTDGHRVPLWVNTGLFTDALRSLDCGAEGVGLFRTEVPFMINARFPSEQQQQKIYRQQLETFKHGQVTMRTLDIGGDKALEYFPIKEDNPFLGWRGIRVTLDHPEIFLMQVRAMIRASEGLNNLRIMLPMITSLDEVEEAQRYIYRAHGELYDDGLDVDMPQVGVMIEVPSVVFQLQDIAQRVDFLSVGSNDLTQYMLAVDRNNPRVADLYSSYHPSVLKVLEHIASIARLSDTPISVCGEMAGDPRGALLLVAMGYEMLSMSATNLPKVKAMIRSISMVQARAILNEALALDSAPVVESSLRLAFEKIGCSHLIGLSPALA